MLKRGFTIWLTGLPCAGKTTLARSLAEGLGRRDVPCVVLDGDEVRARLGRELGFSREDRDENVRRLTFVAKQVSAVRGVAIVAAISPYRAARAEARRELGSFLEVHVDCHLEECIRRDAKGLYRRALAGEIERFTGISDPYEPPLAPEVVVQADLEPPALGTAKVLEALERHGYLVRPSAAMARGPVDERSRA